MPTFFPLLRRLDPVRAANKQLDYESFSMLARKHKGWRLGFECVPASSVSHRQCLSATWHPLAIVNHRGNYLASKIPVIFELAGSITTRSG